MRRAIGVFFASAVLGATALAATAVSLAAESGPRCADIVGETHGPLNFWNSTTGQGEVSVRLLTASGDACKQITYTLVVEGVNEGRIVVPQRGSADFLNVRYTDTDPNICISATTSTTGGKVHDAAPDSGCLAIQSGTPGGPGTFQ